jgi:hypothetical protein
MAYASSFRQVRGIQAADDEGASTSVNRRKQSKCYGRASTAHA